MACALNWSETNEEETKRVVLLIHGLNNSPRVMRPLAKLFNNLEPIAVLSLSLSGHVSGRWGEVSYRLWLEDLGHALKEIEEKYPEIPITAVGFSLGANLLLSKTSFQSKQIDKRLLLAPALFLKPKYKLALEVFSLLSHFGLSIRSRNNPSYIAHKRCIFDAYKALLISIKQIKNPDNEEFLKSSDVSIFMSLRDELLRAKDTRDWANKLGYDFIEITSSKKRRSQHFFLNEEELGADAWFKFSSRLSEEIQASLLN